MKTHTLYICEICDCAFRTKAQAEECERSHKTVEDVVSVVADYKHTGFCSDVYPGIVNVRFNDGTVIPYEFGRGARMVIEQMRKEQTDDNDPF